MDTNYDKLLSSNTMRNDGESYTDFNLRMLRQGTDELASMGDNFTIEEKAYKAPDEKSREVLVKQTEQYWNRHTEIMRKYVPLLSQSNQENYYKVTGEMVADMKQLEEYYNLSDSKLNWFDQAWLAMDKQTIRDKYQNELMYYVNGIVGAASIASVIATGGAALAANSGKQLVVKAGEGFLKLAGSKGAKVAGGLTFSAVQVANFQNQLVQTNAQLTFDLIQDSTALGIELDKDTIATTASATAFVVSGAEVLSDYIFPSGIIQSAIIGSAVKKGVLKGGTSWIKNFAKGLGLSAGATILTEQATELAQAYTSDQARKNVLRNFLNETTNDVDLILDDNNARMSILQAYHKERDFLSEIRNSTRGLVGLKGPLTSKDRDAADKLEWNDELEARFNLLNSSFFGANETGRLEFIKKDLKRKISEQFDSIIISDEQRSKDRRDLNFKITTGIATEKEVRKHDALVRIETIEKNGIAPDSFNPGEVLKSVLFRSVIPGIIGGAAFNSAVNQGTKVAVAKQQAAAVAQIAATVGAKTATQTAASSASVSPTVQTQTAQPSATVVNPNNVQSQSAQSVAQPQQNAPTNQATVSPDARKTYSPNSIIFAAFRDAKTDSTITDSILNQIIKDFHDESSFNKKAKKRDKKSEAETKLLEVISIMGPNLTPAQQQETLQYLRDSSGEQTSNWATRAAEELKVAAKDAELKNGDKSFDTQLEGTVTEVMQSVANGDIDAGEKINGLASIIEDIFGTTVSMEIKDEFMSMVKKDADGNVTDEAVREFFDNIFDKIDSKPFFTKPEPKIPQVVIDEQESDLEAARDFGSEREAINKAKDEAITKIKESVKKNVAEKKYRASGGLSAAKVADYDEQTKIQLEIFRIEVSHIFSKMKLSEESMKFMTARLNSIINNANVLDEKIVTVKGVEKKIFAIRPSRSEGRDMSVASVMAKKVQRIVSEAFGYQSGISVFDEIEARYRDAQANLDELKLLAEDPDEDAAALVGRIKVAEREYAAAKKQYDDEKGKTDAAYQKGIDDRAKGSVTKLKNKLKKLLDNPVQDEKTLAKIAEIEAKIAKNENTTKVIISELTSERHEAAIAVYHAAMNAFGDDNFNPSVIAVKKALANRAVTAMRLMQSFKLEQAVSDLQDIGVHLFNKESLNNVEKYNDWYREITLRKTAYEILADIKSSSSFGSLSGNIDDYLDAFHQYIPQVKENREMKQQIINALMAIKNGTNDELTVNALIERLEQISDYKTAIESVNGTLAKEYGSTDVAARINQDKKLQEYVDGILTTAPNDDILKAREQRDTLGFALESAVSRWDIIQRRHISVDLETNTENVMSMDERADAIDTIFEAFSVSDITAPTIALDAAKISMKNLDTPERRAAATELKDTLIPRANADNLDNLRTHLSTKNVDEKSKTLAEIRHGLEFVNAIDDKTIDAMLNISQFTQLGDEVVKGTGKIIGGIKSLLRGVLGVTNNIHHDASANTINLKMITDNFKSEFLETAFYSNPRVIEFIKQKIIDGYNVTVPMLNASQKMTNAWVQSVIGDGLTMANLSGLVEYTYVDYSGPEMVSFHMNRMNSLKRAYERNELEKAVWKNNYDIHESRYSEGTSSFGDKNTSFRYFEIGHNGIPYVILDADSVKLSSKQDGSVSEQVYNKLSTPLIQKHEFNKRFEQLYRDVDSDEIQIRPEVSMDNNAIMKSFSNLYTSAKIALKSNATDLDIQEYVQNYLLDSKRYQNIIKWKGPLSRSTIERTRSDNWETRRVYSEQESLMMAAAAKEKVIEQAFANKDLTSTNGSIIVKQFEDSILNHAFKSGFLNVELTHADVAKSIPYRDKIFALHLAMKAAYIKYRQAIASGGTDISISPEKFGENKLVREAYESITKDGINGLKPVLDKLSIMQDTMEAAIESSSNAKEVYVRIQNDRTAKLYTGGKKRGSQIYGAQTYSSLDPSRTHDIFMQSTSMELQEIFDINSKNQKNERKSDKALQSIVTDMEKYVDLVSNSIFLTSVYGQLLDAKMYGGRKLVTTDTTLQKSDYTTVRAESAQVIRLELLGPVTTKTKFSKSGQIIPESNNFSIDITYDANSIINYDDSRYTILDSSEKTIYDKEGLTGAAFLYDKELGSRQPISASEVQAITVNKNGSNTESIGLVLAVENETSKPYDHIIMDGFLYKVTRETPHVYNDKSGMFGKLSSTLGTQIDGMFDTRENLLIDAIGTLSVVTKTIQLMTSLFHAVALTEGYIFNTSSTFIDEDEDIARQVLGKTGFGAAKSGYSKLTNGSDINKQVIDIALRNGLTISPKDQMGEMGKTRLRSMNKRMKGKSGLLSGGYNGFVNTTQAYSDWIFNHLGTGYKVNATIVGIKAELIKQYKAGKTPDVDQIARNVVNVVNANLGGVSFDRMGMSVMQRKMLKALVFAPDWTLSNMKTIGDSVWRTGQTAKLFASSGLKFGEENRLESILNKPEIDYNAIRTIATLHPKEYQAEFAKFMGRWYVKSTLIGLATSFLTGLIPTEDDDNDEYWKKRIIEPAQNLEVGEVLLNLGGTNLTPVFKFIKDKFAIDMPDKYERLSVLNLAETFHREPRLAFDVMSIFAGPALVAAKGGSMEEAYQSFTDGMLNSASYFSGKLSTPGSMMLGSITDKSWRGNSFTFDNIASAYNDDAMLGHNLFESALGLGAETILNPDDMLTKRSYKQSDFAAQALYSVVKGMTPSQISSINAYTRDSISLGTAMFKILGVRLETE